ncbi:hypothetical protein ROZALSC1DRAFT_25501 [Rozella allomycis CSF55]|uniref:Uncharacterized protein n=1 Tax=Rozella allomycis (strain CSF55) TaxID=988480 RepID=A0A4P9YBM1_ROZAC|nr:hypothetical protein ROZALSC1DRAFT_25501 [Rozella allomycis CSF55]
MIFRNHTRLAKNFTKVIRRLDSIDLQILFSMITPIKTLNREIYESLKTFRTDYNYLCGDFYLSQQDCVVSEWTIDRSGCNASGRINFYRHVVLEPLNGGKPCPELYKWEDCFVISETDLKDKQCGNYMQLKQIWLTAKCDMDLDFVLSKLSNNNKDSEKLTMLKELRGFQYPRRSVTEELSKPLEEETVVSTFRRSCDPNYYISLVPHKQTDCLSQLWKSCGCTKPFPGKQVIQEKAHSHVDSLEFFKNEFDRLEYMERLFQQSSICLDVDGFGEPIDLNGFFNNPFQLPPLKIGDNAHNMFSLPSVHIKIDDLDFSFLSSYKDRVVKMHVVTKMKRIFNWTETCLLMA